MFGGCFPGNSFNKQRNFHLRTDLQNKSADKCVRQALKQVWK